MGRWKRVIETRQTSSTFPRLIAALVMAALLISASVTTAQALPTPSTVAGAESPVAAVDSFWKAIANRDADGAGKLGLPGHQLERAVAIRFASLLSSDAKPVTVTTYRSEVNGDQAKVWSLITDWRYGYRFDLIKQDGRWCIDRFVWTYPYTVEYARADLSFDPAGEALAGTVTLRLRSDLDGLSGLGLQVYPTLNVANVAVDGQAASIDRWRNSTAMFVNTAPLAAGEIHEVTFSLSGTVHDKDRFSKRIWNDIGKDGAYLAIPLGFDDAQVADLYLDVPKSFQAASAGQLIETVPAGERTTYHYRQNTAGYGLAVGNYQTLSGQLSGVNVRWNLLPEHAAQGQAALDLAGRVLSFYTDKFGACPWPDLTITDIPARHGGGVSFPGNILVVSRITPGVSHAGDWTELIAHEISHQWWGTSVGGIHPWVWEALASYSSVAFVQADAGEVAFQKLIEARRDSYRRARRIGDGSILSMTNRQENRSYFPIVYDKGALVLHMLRYQLGEDAFWRTMNEFATRYAGKEATPWDLQLTAEEISGQQLTSFFTQWLNMNAKLDLSIERYKTSVADTGSNSSYTTSFQIKNVGTAIADWVDVRIEGLNWSQSLRVELKGAVTNVTVATAEAPRRVVLDPDKWLLDLNDSNNTAGVGPLDRGSPMRIVLIGAGIGVAALVLVGLLISYIRRHGWQATVKGLRYALAADDQSVLQNTVDFDPNAVQPDVDYSALPSAERANTDHPELWRDDIRSILATDIGSTTTKALLWVRAPGAAPDDFTLAGRAESPTTVEAPWEDVTLGLTSAIEKIEKLTGQRILADDAIVTPSRYGVGVDLFISTSSAGGGLQMVVAGVMTKMTADSASRAASAAGGIVTEVLSIDDGRLVIDRVKRLRELRPDIILLSGGIDGGDISHVVNLAEQVAVSEPKTRLGGLKTPLVYAGNAVARSHMQRLLGEVTDLKIVDNIRPVMERENTEPARQMIHQLFMEHVMSQAPGYPRLLAWAQNALLPTPGAVGRAIEAFGDKYDINVAAFDIGGATTDVFSLIEGEFHRTVSANLGMSYSATNVLAEATAPNVLRWLPFPCSEEELRDWAANKMIRPTSLPQTLRDLILEQALAREALRLSFIHHRSSLVGLKGVQRRRDMAAILDQRGAETQVDTMAIDALIGSGGVLSHAPRRSQALLTLLDAVQPEGVTEMFVDSIFMSPQLGLLSSIRRELAVGILERDGLYLLGTCIAPTGRAARNGRLMAHVTCRCGDERHEARVIAGQLSHLPLTPGKPYEVTVRPCRGYDVGAGPGRPAETIVEAGLFGLVFDGRGRQPLGIPTEPSERMKAMGTWYKAIGAFSEQELAELSGNAVADAAARR